MVKLTEKDADFIAGVFRELIADNDKAWNKVEGQYKEALEFANMFGVTDNIKSKLELMEKAKERAEKVYVERSDRFQNALLLCMAGSNIDSQ